MIGIILISSVSINIILSIIINVKTSKWHIFHITFLSTLLTVFILYFRLFVFLDNPILLYTLLLSIVVVPFIMIPLMMKYNSRFKEDIQAIIYPTFFTLLLVFFPLNSFINISIDNYFINFNSLLSKAFLELLLNYFMIAYLFFLVKYIPSLGYKSIMISIIIVISLGTVLAYDERHIDNDFNFEFHESVELKTEADNLAFLPDSKEYSSIHYYGYYEDTLHYYIEDHDIYTFGSYNTATEEYYDFYEADSCLHLYEDPMFYQGYTYLGCSGLLGVLYEGEFKTMIDSPNKSFQHSYLLLENNELYLYTTTKIYKISGSTVLSQEQNYTTGPTSQGYSFVTSINNKLFMWSEHKTYYDGYTYEVDFGRYGIVYYDGYIYIPGDSIILKEGEVSYFPQGTLNLLTIDERLYAVVYSTLVDFETGQLYEIQTPKHKYSPIDGLDNTLLDIEYKEMGYKAVIHSIDLKASKVLLEDYTKIYTSPNIVIFYLFVFVTISIISVKDAYKKD